MFANIHRRGIANTGKFYKDMKFIEVEMNSRSGHSSNWLVWIKENIFTENRIGKALADSIFGFSDNFFVSKCLRDFEKEATACLFALRAYKKDRGKLPTTLDELVPTYLPKIPPDPFDGRPLRYSREKRIIYCVGEDLKDEGGSVEERGYMGQWKDPSIFIKF